LCRNRDGIVTFEIRRLAMHIRRALATFAPRPVGRKGCGVPASKSSDDDVATYEVCVATGRRG
jgi:hypothetical protein